MATMQDEDMNETEKEKAELLREIQESVLEVAEKKRGLQRKSLSVYDPQKVARLLYLYSTGSSQTRLVRKYGFDRDCSRSKKRKLYQEQHFYSFRHQRYSFGIRWFVCWRKADTV